MADFPGWLAVRSWKRRESMTDTWALTPPDQRDRVLAFWIRASESDEWTFEQLRALFGELMDASEVPGALQAWANELASSRRRPPTRRGPKGDPRDDLRTMVDVMLRSELGGVSRRQAYREVAEETNRSPEAVESAARRGGRWPSDTWGA